MTTIHTDPTPTETLARVQQACAAMLDPLDVPRTWTARQVNAYEERRRLLDAHRRGIRFTLELLAKPTARRTWVQTALDRLRNAEAAIELMVADAGDSPTSDARGRGGWQRQQAVTASRTALHQGVPYVNGVPVVPAPLHTLLTDTCATCGHTELYWPGPIPALEEELARLTKTIDEHQTMLNSHVTGAEALLAEPVMG